MCAGAIVFSKYLTDAIAGFLLIIPAVNIVFIFTFLGYNKKHKNCYGEYIKEYDKKTFRSCIAFSLAIVLIFGIVLGIKAIGSSSLFKYKDSPNRTELEEIVKDLYGVDSKIIDVQYSAGNHSKDYFGEYEADGTTLKYYASYIPKDNEGNLYISLANVRMKNIALELGNAGHCFYIEYPNRSRLGPNYDLPDPDSLSFKYQIAYYDDPSQAFDDLEELCYMFFTDNIVSTRYDNMKVKIIDDFNIDTDVSTMEFTVSANDFLQIIEEAKQKYTSVN